jgi:hypothetical protein
LNLLAGTALLSGTNPLGNGQLNLGGAGNDVSLGNNSGKALLDNTVTLLGSTIKVIPGGDFVFNKQATLTSDTTINLQAKSSTVTLGGGLSGAHTLTVTNEGKLQLGGALNAATVKVPSKTNVVKLSGFSITNGGSLMDANGNPIP